MNNGKQSEQLLKVLGGHSASLDRTSKCRGLSEQPLYSGGHKDMQHETRNWNNFDKCEPEQQYRLGTVSYKITVIKPYLKIIMLYKFNLQSVQFLFKLNTDKRRQLQSL